MTRLLPFCLALLVAAGCDSSGALPNEIRTIGSLGIADFYQDDTQTRSLRGVFESRDGTPTFASTSSAPDVVQVEDLPEGVLRVTAVTVGEATVRVTASVASDRPAELTREFTVTVLPECPEVDSRLDVMPDGDTPLRVRYQREMQPHDSDGRIVYVGDAELTPSASCSRGTRTVIYEGTLRAERTGVDGETASVSGTARLRFDGTTQTLTTEFEDPFDERFTFAPGRRTAASDGAVTLSSPICWAGRKRMRMSVEAGFENFIMHCTQTGPGGTGSLEDTELHRVD